ncbi:MAG: HNH endonuclease [Acidimicrobiia bacterium]|nr:HNH endonuclease [Acidimicrobiia bacterium]
MSRVLVLNATYEPLAVVTARRAVCLVLADKATLVEDTGRVMRSERASVAEPSVVRLTRFVRVPYQRRRALNRRAVFARDDHTCQYCGRRAESIDHVVPRSRGGEHVWDNVVAACRPCNASKRDRMLSETTMYLRRSPGPPELHTWFRVAAGVVPAPWEPYLDVFAGRASA